LAKWCILCKPKSVGGLGIINLDTQNKCLLSKWLFKLLNEEGLWQDLLRKKYLKNKTLSQVEKRKGDSQFWSGLMEVKKDFFWKGVGLLYMRATRLGFGRTCGLEISL